MPKSTYILIPDDIDPINAGARRCHISAIHQHEWWTDLVAGDWIQSLELENLFSARGAKNGVNRKSSNRINRDGLTAFGSCQQSFHRQGQRFARSRQSQSRSCNVQDLQKNLAEGTGSAPF